MRTLMFKHELRSKRLKKIKSRAFHKHNKKKLGDGKPRLFIPSAYVASAGRYIYIFIYTCVYILVYMCLHINIHVFTY
jgi:hypothetical protein